MAVVYDVDVDKFKKEILKEIGRVEFPLSKIMG